SRHTVLSWQKNLLTIEKAKNFQSSKATEQLLKLPGYQEFVKQIKDTPKLLYKSVDDETFGKRLKLTFLFYIIHISGLHMVHEEALRQINRTLIHLIDDKDYKKDITLVDQTFALLKEHKGTFPETVLDCIHKIGDVVYKRNEIELINHFIDRTVDHGFQFPMITGTGEDWQIKGNSAHVKNIRVFLDLIR
ncbi:MAG: pyruvate, phosphate dikinase, partial [Desulfobacteraceae bacterium]|nr:pyruvate, phosphate dikinase [Desulfobacteraceae bacterium]